MFGLKAIGQSPTAFNYQAVLRDAGGNIRVGVNVTIRVDLLQTSATGTTVYSESFTTTTNTFGLINLQVGKGTVISGTFSTIDWGTGPYFIKITVDGTEMSTSQMLSVPYSLYAAKAGNGFSGVYNDLTGKPNFSLVSTSGSYNDLLNKPSFTETDPIYGVSVAKTIKTSDTTRWSNKSNFSGKFTDLTLNPIKYNSSNSTLSIGENAVKSVTTGVYFNTTGIYNVAMGGNALNKNLTTNKNTAIGFEALKNSESSDNTAVGYQALTANTTGLDNVAIGTNSLSSNTTGNANTAIGKNAMISIVNGGSNTAIGCFSIVANGVSNATAIGNGANADASNKIVLGNGSVTSIGGYAGFTTFSDVRLKENIAYSNKPGLNFISGLRTATYNYKADPMKRQRNGLIAQDVEKTMKDLGVDFSGLVVDDNQQKTLNLAYAEFVIPLINSVQELNLKNQQLQQKNETLEATIMAMKADLELLKKIISK